MMYHWEVYIGGLGKVCFNFTVNPPTRIKLIINYYLALGFQSNLCQAHNYQ